MLGPLLLLEFVRCLNVKERQEEAQWRWRNDQLPSSELVCFVRRSETKEMNPALTRLLFKQLLAINYRIEPHETQPGADRGEQSVPRH